MVNAIANSGKALLQSLHLRFLFSLAILFALREGAFQLLQHVIGDMNIFEDLPQTFSHFLFTNIREIAFPFGAGATVISVFLLFDFRRQHAIVKSASQQTSEWKEMLLIAGAVMTMQHRLHLIKHIGADNQRVSTLVTLTHPLEETGIKRIAQQLVKIALLKRSAGFRANDLPQLCQ
ncbi:MAG TPA: hypothetical protein VFP59_00525 [Candidatus Angelobacter sp.]|nr:hypothetical protein [Candidatus Angelobacter sp.]